jgi:type IV pilus assembly protein PilQ
LVIQGAGIGGALEQQRSGATWNAELRTDRIRGLKVGPQSLAMPDAGMERITFDGTGRLFQLKVSPVAGQVVAAPVVSSDGRDLIIRFPAPTTPVQQNARINFSQPTPVPRPVFVPPLRPRAVAPPLGDMAVGSMMLANRSYLKLSGPPVTLTTRAAQARDVLMVLAQMGGYGFAYSDLSLSNAKSPQANSSAGATTIAPVTVAFRAEPFDRAFNFVLVSSGLQARKEGNTILVGPSILSKNLGSQLSKVYRLNQVSPNAAADYLANLGAQVRKTYITTQSVSEGNSQANAVANAPTAQTTQSSTTTEVEEYGATTGPLVGVQATTDTRLGTITIVGEPALVSIAENYLRQLDLRQRQVALSVKILDVSLNNDTEIDNSFALRFGNNFIVNDGGQMLAAFGRNLPAREADFDNSVENISNSSDSSSSSSNGNTKSTNSGSDRSQNAALNQELSLELGNNRNLTQSQIETLNLSLERETGTKIEGDEADGYNVVPTNKSSRKLTDALESKIEEVISSQLGSRIGITRSNATSSNKAFSVSSTGSNSQGSSQNSTNSNFYSSQRRKNPGLNYPDQQFFDFLRAQIVSSNTKILASPTLILQEGRESYGGSDAVRISGDGKVGRSVTNEAFVRVGTQLVTTYEVKEDVNGNNFCQPVFGNAGLTFGARVDKIDDNGFVTFSLSPEISAAVGVQSAGGCGEINIINDRLLDTGKLRVRDGQTLILTGVISELDRQEVSKWPILGDLPLIGQFFRKTSGARSKSELVIMVTPRIVNDNEGGTYGYGYSPSTSETRQLLYGASAR